MAIRGLILVTGLGSILQHYSLNLPDLRWSQSANSDGPGPIQVDDSSMKDG